MEEQLRLSGQRQSDDAGRSTGSAGKDQVPSEEAKEGNGAYTVSSRVQPSTKAPHTHSMSARLQVCRPEELDTQRCRFYCRNCSRNSASFNGLDFRQVCDYIYGLCSWDYHSCAVSFRSQQVHTLLYISLHCQICTCIHPFSEYFQQN